MNIDQSYNFRKISDTLTTSGSLPTELLETMSDDYGYQAVINLLPPGNKHEIADEKTLVEKQGMVYIQIPVDWQAPTEDNYTAFASALEQTQHQKTHIHCAANWRVSGFYAVYAVENKLWDKSKAYEHILDLWDPNQFSAWKSFFNHHQLDFGS